MKDSLRKILKNILGILSKKTISKHKVEVILVTGWAGTSVVKELIYQLLSKEFHVRRNTKSVWWDLSVPLCILGYEDKRRNIFEWTFIIIKIYLSLLFKPAYSHKIIIDLDTYNEDIAKFWSKYVSPDIIVILKENPNSKVIKMFLERNKTLFVYNPKFFKDLKGKSVRKFIYSQKSGDLTYKKEKGQLELYSKNEKIRIKLPKMYKFIWELIPAAASVGLVEGLKLSDMIGDLQYLDLHPGQVQKGIDKLKKFLHSNEERKRAY